MTDTGELERLWRLTVTVPNVSELEPGRVNFMGSECMIESITERRDGYFDLVIGPAPFSRAALEGKG